MEKLLTIGIPTYNREKIVVDTVQTMMASGVMDHDFICTLIIDNASTDRTFEMLSDICQNSEIRLLRNEQNLGAKRNFIRLVAEAQSKFLLITSDEDPVTPDNLIKLKDFLETRSPGFVSPQMYRYNRLIRGKTTIQKILPSEWKNTAFYISGVVYDVQKVRPVIQLTEKYALHEDQYYPQNVWALLLTLTDECFWFPYVLAEKKHQADDSANPERTPARYNLVCPRWRQFLLDSCMLDELSAVFGEKNQISVSSSLDELSLLHKKTLMKRLHIAIKTERSDLLPFFEEGARQLAKRHSLLYRGVVKAKRSMLKVSKTILAKLKRPPVF